MTEIDWSRLRSTTAREIISALTRDGFSLRNQSGSHRRYRHPDGRRVTVSFRPGDPRGVEVCSRLFDLGKSRYAVATPMDISFAQPTIATRRGKNWATRTVLTSRSSSLPGTRAAEIARKRRGH
jgi:predicted RNA binding protein YcfA (HicA-like mRNA interferase family)